MTTTKPATAIRYRLHVWVTVPPEDLDPAAPVTAQDVAQRITDVGREVERDVIRTLERCEWDCHVELMDSEAIEK